MAHNVSCNNAGRERRIFNVPSPGGANGWSELFESFSLIYFSHFK